MCSFTLAGTYGTTPQERWSHPVAERSNDCYSSTCESRSDNKSCPVNIYSGKYLRAQGKNVYYDYVYNYYYTTTYTVDDIQTAPPCFFYFSLFISLNHSACI
jgi:hypothetical protein